MIEINGQVDPNAFEAFDELIKGKKEVIFVRTDVKPLKVYENWRGEENGYGPSGAPVSIGEKHSISIPMDFYTLRHFKNGSFDQCHVRYYRNKSEVTTPNGKQPVYDTGDGSDSFVFEGSSIKLNVQTAQGKELFRVLMAHPSNSEYPSHGPKKVPLFKLLRPENASKEINDKEKLINKVIALVYNPNEVPDSLKVKIHKSLLADNPTIGWQDTDTLVAANEYETISADLAMFARMQPDVVLELINSANLGLRNTINEAIEYLVIEQTKKGWVWGEKVNKNIREICPIAVGEDPINELISFLLYDKKGKKAHEVIVEALERSKSAEALLSGK